MTLLYGPSEVIRINIGHEGGMQHAYDFSDEGDRQPAAIASDDERSLPIVETHCDACLAWFYQQGWSSDPTVVALTEQERQNQLALAEQTQMNTSAILKQLAQATLSNGVDVRQAPTRKRAVRQR